MIRAESKNISAGLLFWRPFPRGAQHMEKPKLPGQWVALGPLCSACLRGRAARRASCATHPAQSRGWLGPRPLLRPEEGAASACQQLHFLETKKTEGRES